MMLITNKQVYESFIRGAHHVIERKEVLNKINVFPVRDGDTGSNLSSMMRSIIEMAENKVSVKTTLESVADAALYGARGNSGIIFAQYFRGLSESIEGDEAISMNDFAAACRCAAKYAYDAIENPVEGTMITVMREWGNVLTAECKRHTSLTEIFRNALNQVEIALERTKEQMPILKKANVVDSGAKGFTYFIEGAIYYLMNGEVLPQRADEEEVIFELPEDSIHANADEYRYCTECLIEGSQIDPENIKEWLHGMGNSVVVAGSPKKCKVHVHTDDPSTVFEYLYHKGNIIYQKVDDMVRQEAIVNHRKYNIALVTDSIADLPKEWIDEEQIHVVHLDIIYKNHTYLDKLTIQPQQILKKCAEGKELPTSSQPGPKTVENLLDYLTNYYESIIILTVSKELSGTYNSFVNGMKNQSVAGHKISLINTKQNSGAQGLLVKKCADLIASGMEHNEIVKEIERLTNHTKILVQVRNIEHMIRSGRLSVKAGKIAKMVGMKPIITLDEQGKGTLDGVAFSIRGSSSKLIRHIRKVCMTDQIESYSIVHVNNLQAAENLGQVMMQLIGFSPSYICETSSIIAISAGDGAIAVSYLLKRR
ncbi:MAG: DegV family protein [Lachnospiraceae bacterium]|nr:DegV family protein [Lachnospiraceae bacterium]